MREEVLLALITKLVEEEINNLASSKRISLRGLRGLKGDPGVSGKDGTDGKPGDNFSFEDSKEEISKIIHDNIPAPIRGPKGDPGKSFDINEHADQIKSWSREYAWKFKDLTADEINELRGPAGLRGLKGERGDDGKDFIYSDHAEEISNEVRKHLEEIKPALQLKFSDLKESEKDLLRGPRGQRGRAGKDFIFDDHKSYFETLKLKFSDLNEEEKSSLKLRFKDLGPEDHDILRLKFSDLSLEQKLELRGSRGQRGRTGESIKGDKGDRGPRGIQGLPGISIRGLPGIPGLDGEDGADGDDAPYVTKVEVDQRNNAKFSLVFHYSDGTYLETSEISLPEPGNVYSGVFAASGSGSGGAASTVQVGTTTTGSPGSDASVTNSGTVNDLILDFVIPRGASGTDGVNGVDGTNGSNGTDGADGQSAYDIAVANGFSGTQAEWLASLVGPSGSGSDSFLLKNVPKDSAVFVGAAVILEKEGATELEMSDWTNLLIRTMDVSDYTVKAFNGVASSWSTSNIVGIVESISGSNCDIRIGGSSLAIYFGLDTDKEYFLSDAYPGFIVDEDSKPTESGSVLVRIGQPIGPTQLLFERGDRQLIA